MSSVIFDMDGLMFDTERICMNAWDYAGEKIGIGKAGYTVLKTLGMNPTATRKVLRSEFGSYDEVAFQKYAEEFSNDFYAQNKVPVKKGLYSLLAYLKKEDYSLAVASSSPKWQVERNLKDAGLSDYFGVIVSGDMVERSKPEPDIYLKACELLHKNPEECFALEDSKNGLLSAYRAGCKPIMVPDLWQPDEEIKQILFGKFEDLEQVKEYFSAKNKL